MSHYIQRHCSAHGDWEMDVDNPGECPECPPCPTCGGSGVAPAVPAPCQALDDIGVDDGVTDGHAVSVNRSAGPSREAVEAAIGENDYCEDCGEHRAEVCVGDPDPRQVCFPCALAAAWKVKRSAVEKWLIPEPPRKDADGDISALGWDGEIEYTLRSVERMHEYFAMRGPLVLIESEARLFAKHLRRIGKRIGDSDPAKRPDNARLKTLHDGLALYRPAGAPKGWRAEVERVRETYIQKTEGGTYTSAFFACNDVIDALNALSAAPAGETRAGDTAIVDWLDEIGQRVVQMGEGMPPVWKIGNRLISGKSFREAVNAERAALPPSHAGEER